MNNKENERLQSEEVQNFIKAFLKLRDRDEIMKFMRDLMTVREIDVFAKRLKAAQLLDSQNSYIEIERATGLSSATIARVSESLKYGYDGYKLVIDRMKK